MHIPAITIALPITIPVINKALDEDEFDCDAIGAVLAGGDVEAVGTAIVEAAVRAGTKIVVVEVAAGLVVDGASTAVVTSGKSVVLLWAKTEKARMQKLTLIRFFGVKSY